MGTHRANAGLDAKAVARVLQLEAAEGRTAVALPDGTTVGVVSSPPRMIEVRAFAGAADELWLDGEQVDAAYTDPDFWLYVVEHASAEDPDAMVLTRLSGPALHALLDTRVEYRYAEVTWPGLPDEPVADEPVADEADEPVAVAGTAEVETDTAAYDYDDEYEAYTEYDAHDVEFEEPRLTAPQHTEPQHADEPTFTDEPQLARVGAGVADGQEVEEPAPSRWFR